MEIELAFKKTDFGQISGNMAKSPDFGPILPKSAQKIKISPTAMGSQISDLYSGMHLYTKRPDFFEVKKCAIWTHFWCMHHCLGFVHRCMHHNAGEYGKNYKQSFDLFH